MVEVTVIFITTSHSCSKNVPNYSDCTSIYLFKEGYMFKPLSERIYKFGDISDKANEMIAKTPFKVKKLLTTYGLSFIAIVEDLPSPNLFSYCRKSKINQWTKISINDLMISDNIEDKHTIVRFLELYKEGKFLDNLQFDGKNEK